MPAFLTSVLSPLPACPTHLILLVGPRTKCCKFFSASSDLMVCCEWSPPPSQMPPKPALFWGSWGQSHPSLSLPAFVRLE